MGLSAWLKPAFIPSPIGPGHSDWVPRRAICTHHARIARPRPVVARRFASASASAAPPRDRGTFALLAVNVVAFVADRIARFAPLKALYLYHSSWRPWQLVTALFFHGSFAHLSGNLFFLLVFGKLVEEKSGAVGVVLTYMLTGIFANVASLLLIPGSVVSLGASGAVFGLFAVSVLSRLEWNVKSLLETAILGNFVVNRVIEEGSQTISQSGSAALVQTNHIAHLGGALGGVFLMLALNAIASSSKVDS